jgi:hypothetical protein
MNAERVTQMPDRTELFRKNAAECLILARAITDPKTRFALLTMAQRSYDRANCPPADFQSIVQVCNEAQTSRH